MLWCVFGNFRFFVLEDSHSTKCISFFLPLTWKVLWRNNDTNYFEFAVVLKISLSLKGQRKNKGKPALFVLALRLSWEEDESTSSALWIRRTCSQLSGWASVKAMAHSAFLVFCFVLLKKNCKWWYPCIDYPAIQGNFMRLFQKQFNRCEFR